ncbi:MAG TPA: pyruvate ferredoxin oxidoreductase, partial [Atribacterota bacterium]|nr:pyruvate ferredoxin oxidoreductase [Atribacterota bacterium]
ERVDYLDDATVRNFIGTYQPNHPLLDIDKPLTFGPLDLYDYYFEHKRQQAEDIKNSKPIILDVAREFKEISAREYGLFESYHLDDAETAIVVLSSAAGTAKAVVDELRDRGRKVGLLKPRVFRPFPYIEIAQALSHLKAIAILDRSVSFGSFGGPLFTEIRSAMVEFKKIPENFNIIFGLGGRDINEQDITGIYNQLDEVVKSGKVKERVQYLGVRD